jgi:hypothetical protein
VKKTVEERIRALFAEHSIPPMEVIIPILEKTGRGEKELTVQIYNTVTSLANGIKGILNLRDKNMETLAKVCEMVYNVSGEIFEPIELTDSRFSSNMSDCPLLHVGKDISLNVKSKFCDLICTTGSKAMMDTVLSPQKCNCTWDKALIKGAGKCTVVFELVKTT